MSPDPPVLELDTVAAQGAHQLGEMILNLGRSLGLALDIGGEQIHAPSGALQLQPSPFQRSRTACVLASRVGHRGKARERSTAWRG